MRGAWGVAALATALASVAWTDERPPPNVASHFPTTLEEVVVTGTKMPSPEWESTVPVEVVPRERIEETTTLDVQDALAEIPGLYVRRNEQFALGASTVRMQGADPNKVAILMDGRRFRGGIDGVVDLRDIPANNIERIEIIRGPASSLYGSDAMAGVINIITRSGSPELHAEGTAAGGSFARQFYAGSHGWQRGPVRWFLSGLHDEFRLFEQFGAVSSQFTEAREKEKQERDQVGLRLDADLGDRHAFTVFPSFQQQVNPESTNRNVTTAGEWRWLTGPQSELTSWVNWYRFDRENSLPGFQEESAYNDWEGESRWGVELGPGPAWATNRFTAGTRARQQHLDQGQITITGTVGDTVKPPVNAAVWQVSPFLQTDVLFDERWSLLVGSSFDVHERYGLDVNPRATLTWRPSSIARLSATVGRGFRAPDLVQLYGIDVNAGGLYALLGNPDLEPETDLAFNLEAAVRTRAVDGFLTLFRHQFHDLIGFTQVPICTAPGRPLGCVVDPLPGLPGDLRFQTRNFAEAVTQGLELGIELSVLELLEVVSPIPHRITIGLGYAFLDTETRSGIAGEDGNELPFRPRQRVLPQLSYRHGPLGLTVRIWGEFESDAFTDVANSPELLARNHWTWNFKASIAPFKMLPEIGAGALARAFDISRNLEIFGQGDNVFNEEFGPVTGVGRLAGPAAFIFGVNAKF